jgi:glycosyltransferase involved in cell wall biosynthesis
MDYPLISVVIAVYYEEVHISECLDSLLAQTYPGEIEIIVSDGGSTDRTAETVNSYIEKNSNIILLHNPDKYQAFGRNLAIECAKGKFIAYLDGHSYAEKNWLEQLYSTFIEIKAENDNIAGVGSVHYDAERSDFTMACSIAFRSALGGGAVSSFAHKGGLQEVETAYACLYDREVLGKTGGYNTKMIKGEDLELNSRITRKFAYSLYLDPDAVTYYYKRSTLSGLFGQMRSYGFWRIKAMRELKHYKLLAFAPAFLLLALFGLAIAAPFNLIAAKIFVFVFSFYLAAVISESIFHAITYKCKAALIAKIFLVMHFAYGFGMLNGMFAKKDHFSGNS